MKRFLAMMMIYVMLLQTLPGMWVTAQAQETASYKVQLKVTDGEDVIAGATVGVQFPNKEEQIMLTSNDNQGLYQGSIVSENMVSGNCIVSITAKDYADFAGEVCFTLTDTGILSGSVDLKEYKLYKITGKVQENTSNGHGIEAVTVSVEGTKVETQTDNKGEYSLSVRAGEYTLSFKKSGYEEKTDSISVHAENVTYNQVLKKEMVLTLNVIGEASGGTLTIKKNGTEYSKELVKGKNKISCYYNEPLQVSVSANSYYYIDTTNSSDTEVTYDGQPKANAKPKANVASIKVDKMQQNLGATIAIAEYTSIIVTLDNNNLTMEPYNGLTRKGNVCLDSGKKQFTATPKLEKYYPVVEADEKICEKLSYGIYGFKGNGSAKVSFQQDNTKPVVTISGNDIEELYTNHDRYVYLDVKEDESGIKSVTSQIPDRDEQDMTGKDYKLLIERDIFIDGIEGVPVTFTATDNVGNEGSKKLQVYYDTKAPVVESVSLGGECKRFTQNGVEFVNGEPLLAALVTDNFNKDCELLYYVSQSELTTEQLVERIGDFSRVTANDYTKVEYTTAEDTTVEYTYTFAVDSEQLVEGQNYVYVTAEDKAENIQLVNFGFYSLNVDKTAPEVSSLVDGSVKSGNWKQPKDSISMNGVVTDSSTPSGLSYSYVVTKASAAQPQISENATWVLVGDANKADLAYAFLQDISEERTDGSYKVWLWAKDGCDNISKPAEYVFHIDGTSPKVEKLSLHVEEDNIPSKRIFSFAFGNFFHRGKVEGKTETVYLTVEVEDSTEEVYLEDKPQVGEVYLYYETLEEEGKGSYVEKPIKQNKNTYYFAFEVPENQVFYCIRVVAEDKAENETCSVPTNNGYASDLVMIDQIAPKVTFQIDGEYREPDYSKKEGEEVKEWYQGGKDVAYQITATDSDSGIFQVNLDINGKNLLEDLVYQKKPQELVNSTNYTVCASDGTIQADGRFSFAASVLDNAGNSTQVSKNIYIDVDKPKIKEIKFESGEKDELTVVPQQYGYFFRKETKVTVTAVDYIGNSEYVGSGVKDITYYLESAEGSKSEEKKLKVTETEPGIFCADFTVPADFKGQIYMYATDQVGQHEEYKNPKGVVIESLEDHCSKYSHTIIEMPKTSYKDGEGNLLYNHQPTLLFGVMDSKSGIASSEWSVKKLDQTLENEGVLNISAVYQQQQDSFHSVLSSDTDWTVSSKMDLNLVTDAQKKYGVSTEQNHMVASLKMTDNAGNSDKAVKETFSVDTTAPVVTVEYDNNEVYNEKYYNKERTAVVTVVDANFSKKECEFALTGPTVAISEWEHVAGTGCDGKAHGKDCAWKCSVAFVEDGDYTFGFSCKDLAGWSGKSDSIDEFTIDKTDPIIQVTYDNNDVRNEKYYKEARIATVQIEEHNFEAGDVEIIMTATDNGKSITVPTVNGWSQNEDYHTAVIAYDYDGEFSFEIAYTDLANNEAEAYQRDEFVVDLTEPELEITGVEDQSANNGKVAPVIRCKDTNLDLEKVERSLTGINGGSVSCNAALVRGAGEVQYLYEDMPHKRELDDLYTLQVKAEDKAGNQVEQEIRYSVNRFGSVYIMTDATQELIDQCYTNQVGDLVIQEVNVDELTQKKVTYSRDGEIVTLEEGEGYTLKKSGGKGSWNIYDYVIYGDNFEEEGRYIVSLYSEDKASNASDNKVKGKNVEFVVDKTAPSVIVSGVTAKGQYNQDTRTASINVEDNIGVETVTIYLDGKKTATFQKEQLELSDGTMTLALKSSNQWQELQVVSRDYAGNESSSENIRFLLTRNALVQWYQNSTAFYGSLGGLILITLAGVFFFRRKKVKAE